jgi:predicted nucleotidyltransferase
MSYQDFLLAVKNWALEEQSIESILLVGSYARNEQRADSDIDLVIITSSKNSFIEHPGILKRFGVIVKQDIEYWGACTSIRVWYENSFEIEFGFVEPSWIDEPLDKGTYRTLRDGYQVILDKPGYFQKLVL